MDLQHTLAIWLGFEYDGNAYKILLTEVASLMLMPCQPYALGAGLLRVSHP